MALARSAGRAHDLTAARTHGVIRSCERQGVPILADRAYMGAGPWVTTPLRRPPGRGLTPTQQTVNRALSAARAPLERGVARLKSWRIFRHARCSPNRMTSIAKAVLTLERHRCTGGQLSREARRLRRCPVRRGALRSVGRCGGEMELQRSDRVGVGGPTPTWREGIPAPHHLTVTLSRHWVPDDGSRVARYGCRGSAWSDSCASLALCTVVAGREVWTDERNRAMALSSLLLGEADRKAR